MGGLLGLAGFGAIVNGSFGPVDELSVLVLALLFLIVEAVVLAIYLLVRRSETAPPTAPTRT